MEQRGQQRNGLSYSNLFNLDSLVNFQVPQPEDDYNNYDNGSQDESRSTLGHGLDRSNGAIDGSKRRKKHAAEPSSTRRDFDSNDEDDEDYDNRITEEHYRSMLSDHVQKYRRVRFRESASNSGSIRMAVPYPKRSNGAKATRLRNEPFISAKERSLREMEASEDYNEREFDAEYYGISRFASTLDNAYLDIGEGISYRIPPTYDKIAASLKLPSFSDIRVEEYYLKGTLDLRTLAEIITSDRRSEAQNRGGLCEPQPQYESLQARLKGLSNQKFALQICDVGLDPFSIPEGAAGRIRRSIISENGTLQVYYVKVLEKGDTYEIIERSLPKKQIAKKDPAVIEKEEMEKIGKVWINIVRKDIPRHHRIFTNFHRKQLADAKRCSETCQREVKLKVSRSLKLMRSAAIHTRKLARDMLIFWKRVDKEQAELRKKEERDAAEALKREEELREAKRQQQRLNFLLSQTELYSHFMQNKPNLQSAGNIILADGNLVGSEEGSALADVEPDEEEDPEEAELKREALRAAQHAVSVQKKKTDEFDSECLKLRQAAESAMPVDDSATAGPTNIDLLNPSTMPVTSSVQTPELFKGRLKEYQLKGLQWLVNCYEQGLNGILADEMGLGKTIQAMAFLAHLAEVEEYMGAFLVVAPASVLNNWVDEISRFCPDLKALPYWGGLQERTILRKNINPKRLYRREAGFHILITSYQLLVTDEKYLRRVKWQYMVLDEAQAIKSSNSIRWKTLLSFNCRNRLLLTGTPIQNNMAELWALLHFIMPTLFDSHEQFNEWFSKGIESHAEHGGTLNEHQLNRLHAVLKPFMLRRVKKDVISEMTGKTEVIVHCKLSSRQQLLYQAIKNKISLAELLDSSRGRWSEKKLLNLMNIVIQLRKVCNHPELFERNEGSTYFYFADVRYPPLPSFGELEDVFYAGESNPITYKVPKLVHQKVIRNTELPCSVSGRGLQRECFDKLFNIFSTDNIHQSALAQSGSFGFTRLMNLSPGEASFLANSSLLEKLSFSVMRWDRQFIDEILDIFLESESDDFLHHNNLNGGKVRAVARMLLLPTKFESSFFRDKLATGPCDAPFEALVSSHQDRFIANTRLLRATHAFIPRVRAPPVNAHCSDRSFAYQRVEELQHPFTKKLLLGFSRTSKFNGPRKPVGIHHFIQEVHRDLPIPQPILELPYKIFGSSPPMQSFDLARMLTDSGKLHTLDILLKRLRAENHRVLLFVQMTKMMDIIEDYMNYRKYKYLRLDGSSSIMSRRDMVRDFQCRNDIFVFVLSTRAGGLGINLTAADTVIFYESDWNPTLDLQAMDRAHRLGQTKEVTVYRLICKETVEEKILQRASQKNTVQQLVMTGGHVQGDLLKPEDVVSLLLDDAQLEQNFREVPLQAKDRQKKKRPVKGIRVDEEGDVTFEDVNSESADQETGANKKRKSNSQKQAAKSRNSQKADKDADLSMVIDEPSPFGYDEDQITQRRPKRPKRPTKSINEDIEPALGSGSTTPAAEPADDYSSPHDYGTPDPMAGTQRSMRAYAHSPMT
uniref:Chromatin-remodeling ATPase INO80 n=1 Tax=Ananas comosus var. bracteatus TaxID=296719 RepID=A0A6V7PCV4_ANACO|nr:unnamed protein product [Ananas comosus var. bracteatus]